MPNPQLDSFAQKAQAILDQGGSTADVEAATGAPQGSTQFLMNKAGISRVKIKKKAKRSAPRRLSLEQKADLLQQVETIAKEQGVSLRSATASLGHNPTDYYRWRTETRKAPLTMHTIHYQAKPQPAPQPEPTSGSTKLNTDLQLALILLKEAVKKLETLL